jgi:hypothetical protein
MAEVFWDTGDGGVASPDDNTKQCHLLWHPYILFFGKSSSGAKTNGHMEVLVLHENARPIQATTQTLASPKFSVLPHLPYSPYLAQSGYLSTLFSKTLNLNSPLKMREQASHPHKTEKISFVYIVHSLIKANATKTSQFPAGTAMVYC